MNRMWIISFLTLSSVAALADGKPARRTTERTARPDTITLHDGALSLRVDPTRVALFTESEDQDSGPGDGQTRGRAAVAGLGRRTPIGVRSCSIATVEPHGASAADVVADLAEDPAYTFVAPVLLGQRDLVLIPTGELLVMLQPGVAREAAEALLEQTGGGVILERAFGGLPGAYRLRLNTRDGFAAIDAANALAALPQVKFAEPDMICQVEPDYTPNDPLFPEQWGLHNTGQEGGLPDMDMDVPEAWDTTLGDPSVTVVVLDVGVELDHPDLNVWYGADFTDDGPAGGGGPVSPCDRHGTAVAGCVGATLDNDLGLAGAAPGCAIASARYIRRQPGDPNDPCLFWVQWSWWIDALEWAHRIGARVTVNSNSFGGWSAAVEEKMQQTRAVAGEQLGAL
jgi:subtilisin family serine protease